MVNHLEEAKLNMQHTEDILSLNRDNYIKDCILHALIAIAEQLEITNKPEDKAKAPRDSYDMGYQDGYGTAELVFKREDK